MKLPPSNIPLIALIAFLSAISAPFLPGEIAQFVGMRVVAQTNETQKAEEAIRLVSISKRSDRLISGLVQ